MTEEEVERQLVKDARAAMLAALQNRATPTFLSGRDVYGRSIAQGEAALHGLLVVESDVSVNDPKEETVEIPRWIFEALIVSWRIFLMTGSSLVDRKTLGQVFGVEAMAAGGREGAKLALSTWQELRTYGVAKATEIECNRNGLHPSQEELASEIADCLAGGKHLPNVGDVTVARYL